MIFSLEEKNDMIQMLSTIQTVQLFRYIRKATNKHGMRPERSTLGVTV